MAPDPGKDARDAPLPRRRRIAQWAMWGIPSRVLAPVLLVEAVAVLLVVVGLAGRASLPTDRLWVAVTLGLVGMATTEVAVGIERVRRRVTDGNHVDMNSVWTFAAALVLPGAYAALLAIVVHLHIWWRAWRPRVPLYKQLFSTATVVLACFAATASLEYAGGTGLGPILLALLAYTTVNSCLVAGAIAMSIPNASLAKVFASWEENMLEIATLCLGALTAVAVTINLSLITLILPPMIVLHRARMVSLLQEAATTDVKTGLLNAAAWHSQAEQALKRSQGSESPRGVLVLDLDHFKAVNDSHGHIAGDQVLLAVAKALTDEVRDRDLVGRFGGEEFVVLLSGLPGDGVAELRAVAERMRGRVAGLRVQIPTPDGPLTVAGLTVSIGGAVHPGPGQDLRSLLQIADTALYSAKRDGRNKVRMGLSMPGPRPAAARQAGAEQPPVQP